MTCRGMAVVWPCAVGGPMEEHECVFVCVEEDKCVCVCVEEDTCAVGGRMEEDKCVYVCVCGGGYV